MSLTRVLYRLQLSCMGVGGLIGALVRTKVGVEDEINKRIRSDLGINDGKKTPLIYYTIAGTCNGLLIGGVAVPIISVISATAPIWLPIYWYNSK